MKTANIHSNNQSSQNVSSKQIFRANRSKNCAEAKKATNHHIKSNIE